MRTHPDYGEDMQAEFQPMTVWWGSANWTGGASDYLEVGFSSSDPKLEEHATDFVADFIAFSEPAGSSCASPEPNMLTYEVDDAAMWEASEQRRLDHEGDEEDYDF